MKIKKFLIVLIMWIIATSITYSFQADSENYKQNLVVSSGGEIINSGNYKSYVATGIISGVINSSTYKNMLGFFYTWLLADDQPCTSASQCEGGYCCSNLCKSSSCPVAEPPAGGGEGGAAAGGGAGGGGFFQGKQFTLRPENITAKLTLGEESEKKLTIENTGSDDLNVSLTVENVKGFVFLSEDVVAIGTRDEKEVDLTFVGNSVGSFVGKITGKADGIEQTVAIIIEVISKLVLFDVKLDIPAGYTEVEPGSDLRTQITLLSLGVPGKVDVLATYFIKDLNGNIIYEETEVLAVEKQISYQKVFGIHEDTIPGSHVAIVEIKYADSFAVSSQLFKVVEKKVFIEIETITKNTTLMIILALILVGVISMLIYKRVSIKKRGRKKKKVRKK